MSRALDQDLAILKGLHVLFVDDSADERDLFELRLRQFEAEIVTAETASQALGFLERAETDVLVTDIMLPEISGCELVDAMHSLAPERGGAVPAIAVTGFVGPLEGQRAWDVGFDALLMKPYETADLLTVLAGLRYRIEQLRAMRERLAVNQIEQRALRERLVMRRDRLERERIQMRVKYGQPEVREVATERLIVLAAKEYADAYFGSPVDSVEIASSLGGDERGTTWLVCVMSHGELLLLDVTVSPKAIVSIRRHSDV
jgi:CheY-like chemotaxis protein